MAEEEKKDIFGESEIILEERRQRARYWREVFVNHGYNIGDAHNLAILQVRKEVRNERIDKLYDRKTVLDAEISSERRSDIKENLRDKKEACEKEIENLSDQIKKINKDYVKIVRKKRLLEKGKDEIEKEYKKKLNENDYFLKTGKILKAEHDREKQKIDAFYNDVLETQTGYKPEPAYHIISTDREHAKRLFRKTKWPKALPFKRECPTCHKRMVVEVVDESTGEISWQCNNPKCTAFEAPFSPYIEKNKGRMPFFGLRARERANKRLAYEKRLEPLKDKYWKGEISEEEYQTKKEELNEEIWGKETSRVGKGFVTRVGGPLAKLSRGAGEGVKGAFFAACLIGLGALVSAIFQNWLFFFGFLSVSIHVLIPSPDKGKREEGPMGWGHILPWAQGGTHAGFAWMRSITKVSAIILFAYGFRTMGDIFNIFFIITCIAGYFMLAVGYDPKQPGEFIESLLRFGILGCYFIPFYVFAGIFNSYVLGIIAFAFFAIPPMPKTEGIKDLSEVLSRGLSGQTAYYEMADKILFLGLMLFALIGSGSLGAIPGLDLGWQLTGTLKYTFIYFWIISLIGGFFSPARERPLTGILFLGGATIIYGIGPGSQDIGSALLGQWWPTVNQSVMQIAEPIGKMFGTLGKTFGDAFLLLTNPVGYATQLMNGSYSSSGVETPGAYGLELSGFEVSPVFIEQPFMITANVKNSGAYDATNVSISFASGAKAPESRTNTPIGTVATPAASKTLDRPIKISQTGVTGCENQDGKESICTHYYTREQPGSKFTRQNIWQTVFSSSGITCAVSSEFELRKKYIPINVTLSYEYQSDSKVSVEFISQAEWDRLARLDQLESKLQLVKSEYSTAPVKFPIGTPGLKNPILETQDFHIALNIMSDQAGGKIVGIESIRLDYPADFELAEDGCSPKSPKPSQSPGAVEWKGLQEGDRIFYCHFKALKQDTESKLAGSPTKTYIVTAHANYIYMNSKEKLVKVEFGSWCCENSDCASGYACQPEDPGGKGICVPGAQVSTSKWTTSSFWNSVASTMQFVSVADLAYAAERLDFGGGKLLLGMGGVGMEEQCLSESDVKSGQNVPLDYKEYAALDLGYTHPDFGKLTMINDKFCGFENAPVAVNRAAYLEWMDILGAEHDYLQEQYPASSENNQLTQNFNQILYKDLPTGSAEKIKQAIDIAGKCNQPTAEQTKEWIDRYAGNDDEKALIKAVINTESGFRHCRSDLTVLRSKSGCTGFMQLSNIALRDLGQGYGRYQPEQNIRAGAAYLQQMLNTFNSIPDPDRKIVALAAYNQGPTLVSKAVNAADPKTWQSIRTRLSSIGTSRNPSAGADAVSYAEKTMSHYYCYMRNPDFYFPIDSSCKQLGFPA